MPRKRILLTVTTYPLPSRSYDELVCTAGIEEDGTWIRIYPIPLSFLNGLKYRGQVTSTKYTWIELELNRRTEDFRPESYSPKDYEFKDLIVLNHLDTKSNWLLRKQLCLKNVYTNLTTLIEHSKAPTNTSLATFKPTSITKLVIEKDTDEWKDEWKMKQQQKDLFSSDKAPKELLRKVPYKFSYQFTDDAGRSSTLMIEDWELGALYWNCLKTADGDEAKALEKVSQRYDTEFRNDKDLHFFLGTVSESHRRRFTNPFVIIGVFYPKKEAQLSLF
jgi:hypothetical protein